MLPSPWGSACHGGQECFCPFSSVTEEVVPAGRYLLLTWPGCGMTREPHCVRKKLFSKKSTGQKPACSLSEYLALSQAVNAAQHPSASSAIGCKSGMCRQRTVVFSNGWMQCTKDHYFPQHCEEKDIFAVACLAWSVTVTWSWIKRLLSVGPRQWQWSGG